MDHYETYIYVTCYAENRFEAAEKAGKAVNIGKLKNGMAISAGEAIPVRNRKIPAYSVGNLNGKRKKYKTIFKITGYALDWFDAAETANDLFSINKMEAGTVVCWESTDPVYIDTGEILFDTEPVLV